MSVRWLSSVWSDPDLKSKTELLVMLAIADYSNEAGKAWPSIETLAGKSRISQRQVHRVVSALSRRGKLRVELCAGPHKTNIYSILSGGVTPCHPDSSDSKTRRKTERLLSPDPSVPVSTRHEPSKEGTRPSVDEVKLFCAKSGIADADAVWFFHKCEGNGWTNGGKPIKRWTSTLIAWKTAGYLPSQKQLSLNVNGHGKHLTPEPIDQELRRLGVRI